MILCTSLSHAALFGCGANSVAYFYNNLVIVASKSCANKVALQDEDGKKQCFKFRSFGKPMLKIRAGVYRGCLENIDPDSELPLTITALELLGFE